MTHSMELCYSEGHLGGAENTACQSDPSFGGPKNFLARFVAHCESCAHDVENRNFEIRVYWLSCFLRERRKTVVATCISFFSIIVKSLQLCKRRQIAESRKYCLVHVIVFFGLCFFYFFVSHRLGISG